MALVPLVQYEDASAAVRAVYDDIRATRRSDYINDFWKALANDPAALAATWTRTRETMAAGALDALTKELAYLAVSITNNCEYCIRTHHAAATAKGMTAPMFAELVAVTALANANNRIANGLCIEVDAKYRTET